MYDYEPAGAALEQMAEPADWEHLWMALPTAKLWTSIEAAFDSGSGVRFTARPQARSDIVKLTKQNSWI